MKPERKKQILEEVSKLLDSIKQGTGNVNITINTDIEYHYKPDGDLDFWTQERVTAYLDDYDTEMKVGLEEHVIVKINCDTDQETVESVIK